MTAPADPIQLSAPVRLMGGDALLGEGPVWDKRRDCVFWVDIKGRRIFRYDPALRIARTWRVDRPVSFLTPDGPGQRFIAGAPGGFFHLDLDENSEEACLTVIAALPGEPAFNRMNDGKRAPDGSVWAGTMDDREQCDSGAWWRLGLDGQVERLAEGYRVTNGPAFDVQAGRVYVTDSARGVIRVGALIDGGAGVGRLDDFVQFGSDDGAPDGMEVDAAGTLWVAFWDGGCLRRFSSDGRLIQQIETPTPRPTSLTWAPGAAAKLFITSAQVKVAGGKVLGGSLFAAERVG